MAAIYMWFEDEVQIFTTTLYPIEVQERAQISASFSGGFFQKVRLEEWNLTSYPTEIVFTQILIATDPGLDEWNLTSYPLEIVFAQVLIATDPGLDEWNLSSYPLEIVFTSKLVSIYTPDEKLWLGASLDAANCSMTPV